MKNLFYIFVFTFALTACTQSNQINNEPQIDTANSITHDMPKTFGIDHRAENEINTDDSLIIISDSLFIDLEPALSEIQESDFERFKYNYKGAYIMDSGHFIRGSGLYLTHNCNEICETFLIEKGTNRRMLLPSDYDAGILGLLISSTCNQMIVYSSYDGPDYVNYYGHRAEFFVFNITLGKGLNGITPAFKYFANDFSIDELIYVNDKTIALKHMKKEKYLMAGDRSISTTKCPSLLTLLRMKHQPLINIKIL